MRLLVRKRVGADSRTMFRYQQGAGMKTATVRAARASEVGEIAEMCFLLWPDSPVEEHQRDVEVSIVSGMSGTMPTAVLVAEGEDGELVGFVEVDLRSHADGCDVSQPVGFVEGWFVREAARGRGIGGALRRAAEEWARQRGCREMGSDTWVDHEVSQKAHEALGFEIVDRCVHFRKAL
jgi:aminoglycoside 6'-N-acetyltransferase I